MRKVLGELPRHLHQGRKSMTVKEMRKAAEARQVVYFCGSEYYIVGFVSHYGREPYMTSKVPEDDWWYQIILKDFHSAAKTVREGRGFDYISFLRPYSSRP